MKKKMIMDLSIGGEKGEGGENKKEGITRVDESQELLYHRV